MKTDWNWMIMRGIFGVIFGFLVFMWPATALVTLTVVFAIYVLVIGALSIATAFSQYRNKDRWGLLAFEGLAGIFAGVAALFFPGLALFSLMILIAVWALITGFLEIALAFSARGTLDRPVWLGLAGAASVVFGIALLAWPLSGIRLLVAFIGAYAVINGFLFIVWGIQRKVPTSSGTPLRSAFGT